MSKFQVEVHAWNLTAPGARSARKRKLVQLLGTNLEEIESIFTELPAVFKNNLSHKKAEEFERMLVAMGAVVQIVPMEEEEISAKAGQPVDDPIEIPQLFFWDSTYDEKQMEDWKFVVKKKSADDQTDLNVDSFWGGNRSVDDGSGACSSYLPGDDPSEDTNVEQTEEEITLVDSLDDDSEKPTERFYRGEVALPSEDGKDCEDEDSEWIEEEVNAAEGIDEDFEELEESCDYEHDASALEDEENWDDEEDCEDEDCEWIEEEVSAAERIDEDFEELEELCDYEDDASALEDQEFSEDLSAKAAEQETEVDLEPTGETDCQLAEELPTMTDLVEPTFGKKELEETLAQVEDTPIDSNAIQSEEGTGFRRCFDHLTLSDDIEPADRTVGRRPIVVVGSILGVFLVLLVIGVGRISNAPEPKGAKPDQTPTAISVLEKAERLKPEIAGMQTWSSKISELERTTYLELVTLEDLIGGLTFELTFYRPLEVSSVGANDGAVGYKLHKVIATGVISSKNIERKLPRSNKVVKLLVADSNAELHLTQDRKEKTARANLRVIVERTQEGLLRGAFRIAPRDLGEVPDGQDVSVSQTTPDELAINIRSAINLNLKSGE
jgi:hypothetical protein